MTGTDSVSVGSPRIVAAEEYHAIDVDTQEILDADGRLRLNPHTLNRYVSADFKGDRIRLSAKGVTGLLPLNDLVTLVVRPRFPLRNLTHMVTTCGYPPTVLAALRDYEATSSSMPWMEDVMADALLLGLESIERQGLYRSYVIREDDSSYPRGRIKSLETMQRYASRGISHKVSSSWYQRSVDIPVNRCLKAALLLLYRSYTRRSREGNLRRGDRYRVTRLSGALRSLEDVSPDPAVISLQDPEVRGVRLLPEARSYYREPLDMAVKILEGRGFSLDSRTGPIHMRSLLVKTEDLFEDYIRLMLEEGLAERPLVQVLNGNRSEVSLELYRRPSAAVASMLPHAIETRVPQGPTVNPDIVFRLRNGEHLMVADVKYTETDDKANRSELEQVLLYALRYGASAALTIHPCRHGEQSALLVTGQIGDVLVAQYKIDLGASDIRSEVDLMSQRVGSLVEAQLRRLFPRRSDRRAQHHAE